MGCRFIDGIQWLNCLGKNHISWVEKFRCCSFDKKCGLALVNFISLAKVRPIIFVEVVSLEFLLHRFSRLYL